ncbi:MAG: CBS domain-containing protein [Alphaproteobacteria bacterium]|nr:CBS domain-containing protein [Alphaproteobacteria bacterium]
MQRKIVPDVVREQKLAQVPETMTVRDAASLMAKRHIGAVLVMEGARLIGIFTERDLMSRVVAAGVDPDRTPIGQVMTRNPDTIGGDEAAIEAVRKMQRFGYRHLPVVQGAQVVGIISVRDLYAAVLDELEEDIKDRDAFIHGTAYGVSN